MVNAAPAVPRPAVLVVDDDPSERTALAKALAGLGAEAVQARDGRRGIAMLCLRPFDAVLLDRDMPVVDARRFLAMADEIRLDLPPVVLLGGGSNGERLDHPAIVARLEKPVPLAALERLVEDIEAFR